jgi:hypothetical protein
MARPFHPPSFHRHDVIWRRVQEMEVLVVHHSPASRFLGCLLNDAVSSEIV